MILQKWENNGTEKIGFVTPPLVYWCIRTRHWVSIWCLRRKLARRMIEWHLFITMVSLAMMFAVRNWNVSRRCISWRWISTTCDVSLTMHYNDVIMRVMASHITGVSSVYSIVGSGEHRRTHQSFASLAFVPVIHRWPVNSPHKRPVMQNIFPFDDVIMEQ